MTSYSFQTTTHGKWILAGEHAVLRGHPALVFPVKSKTLTLSYLESSSTLCADYSGESGPEMQLLFWSVLEHGLQLLGSSLNELKGQFHLDSNIPVGVGMGASAALCVAMTRWFVSQKRLEADKGDAFARTLENLFHGQSSGVDIAGVSAESGAYFLQGQYEPIKLAWFPKWYLSSCSQIGMTSHCVQKVKHLWAEDEQLGKRLDLQMTESVKAAKEALEIESPTSIDQLVKAIETSSDCFKQWGLLCDSLNRHMSQLKLNGAIAVKPTGSGGGGYAMSLWAEEPPLMDIELIAI